MSIPRKLKLRRVSIANTPWEELLKNFRTEYDERVLVYDLGNCNVEWDSWCFDLEIAVSSLDPLRSRDLAKYGWFEGSVEGTCRHRDIIHCYFDEGRSEWRDFECPAKILTRAAYVGYAVKGGGFCTQAIFAQVYVDDHELAKRVTGKWLDQMRERKAELITQEKAS